MDPANSEQIRQFLIDELMDDTEEEAALMLLKEWKKQQESESSSSRRTRKHLKRDREGGHVRLFKDYFSAEPVYPDNIFRRRFRMRKELFLRIVEALENHSQYFQWRVDAIGKKGLSPLQKCTAAIRQLAYGGAADQFDEYIRIGESTAIECLYEFCQCVINIFSPKYLRRPNNEDVRRLLHLHSEHHGFPGI